MGGYRFGMNYNKGRTTGERPSDYLLTAGVI